MQAVLDVFALTELARPVTGRELPGGVHGFAIRPGKERNLLNIRFQVFCFRSADKPRWRKLTEKRPM
jgi:hypothetical protein